VKEQLEKLVLEMYRSGIRYVEAVREFQRVFILTVLREQISLGQRKNWACIATLCAESFGNWN
jgi:hypothetical protein